MIDDKSEEETVERTKNIPRVKWENTTDDKNRCRWKWWAPHDLVNGWNIKYIYTEIAVHKLTNEREMECVYVYVFMCIILYMFIIMKPCWYDDGLFELNTKHLCSWHILKGYGFSWKIDTVQRTIFRKKIPKW